MGVGGGLPTIPCKFQGIQRIRLHQPNDTKTLKHIYEESPPSNIFENSSRKIVKAKSGHDNLDFFTFLCCPHDAGVRLWDIAAGEL